MLLRLAVLGTLGYLGYREFQKTQVSNNLQGAEPQQVALAGGPLSDQARIQSDPNVAPSVSTTGHGVGSTAT